MTADQRDAASLPMFGTGPERCPKCLHADLGLLYQPNTSGWGCALGKRLSTSYGPEHFHRWCIRCGFKWEEAVHDGRTDA